jgi:hypothetical protein
MTVNVLEQHIGHRIVASGVLLTPATSLKRFYVLYVTINVPVRPVFYSGRYATGKIPINHPCLQQPFKVAHDLVAGITFSN